MFLTLHSPTTRDFRPLIGRAVFAWLACVCVVASTTCDRRRQLTVLLKPSLQTIAINHIKETSHFNKDAILLVFIEITVKSVRWTGLRYLLTDLLLIETKLALVRPEPNSLKAECCSGEDVLAFLSAGFVKTTKV